MRDKLDDCAATCVVYKVLKLERWVIVVKQISS